MAKFINPTKVITGVNTRWSYVNAWEPKSINGGAPKYSVSLIIPKSDTKTIEKIQAAIQAAWNGGMVYVEEQYPNILFAKDGEIYNFNGKSVIVIGGAYSVDKYYRLNNGLMWFDTEQPDDEIKAYVESKLDKANWSIDIVLSHTVPIEAEPVWNFIPGIDQTTVDKSTEQWLQRIYDNLDLREGWYAGHYHCEAEENGIRILFEDYDEICEE